jgi:two-component system, NarL family, sensor histidine kinase UhpB
MSQGRLGLLDAPAPRTWSSLPLFWRVFVTNAVVLVSAFVGLVAAPIRVSVPIATGEFVVLGAGLVALLMASLLLLRPAFRPLDELAETMRRHDPLSPGARAAVDGDPDVVALAHAFNEMLERLEFERRDSGRSALRLQEAERHRVARELHDEVGQTLTGVMLQVEGLSAAIPTDLRAQLDELRETARHGIEEVRRIARRLRPEVLEDLGLESALAALATAIGDQTRIVVHRHLEPAPALSGEHELVVYRVAQEALTNVARHAAAESVELVLAHDHRRTVLTVADNGCGLAAGSLPSAHGIRGMRERAMLIGAGLTISARPGGGTQVQLVVAHPSESSI